MNEVIQGRRESYTLEKRYIRKDTSQVWVNLMVAVVRDAQGNPDYFISVVEDISQRKQVAEDLRQSEEKQRFLARELEIRANELESRVQERTHKLEEANRYKSQFLSHMSHELRTPLNSILGFTTILLNELPGPLNPEQKYQLSLIKGSANQLLALVSTLLDLAAIEAGKVTVRISSFNPQTVINQVLETVRLLAENKDLKLEQATQVKDVQIRSDEVKFKQILLNLLSNAIKFTDAGGVTITAALLKGEAAETAYSAALKKSLIIPANAKVSLHNDKFPHTLLKIEVIDTGIGIPPQKLGQLFEEFGQLEEAVQRRQGGSGLGLVVTKHLVELLAGWIEAKSQLGVGSSFTVYLPLLVY